ncbi:MAG: nucleotidyltransferase domain-containing protein [Clostridia bacterium]|nr:nucleotidyltransferase domain-containing protein [Clostridia bacterium]
MHSAGSQITSIIQRFKESLEHQGITPQRIILFGSRARDTAGEYSDIDLMVISDDFRDLDFMQRCAVLGRAIAAIMEPIEPLAYTPEEFEHAQEQKTGFLYTVLADQEAIEYRL